MKFLIFALSAVMSSAAFAGQMIECPSFGDTLNTSIQIDPATNKASVNTKFGSSPYSLSSSSLSRKQAGPGEVTFEGDNLVDTGKVILFNNHTGAVRFFTYNLMTSQETTIGPVNCELR